ncbi:MAG TPA: glycosyltransferase, partial [Ferruginibacter sp.]|nr:glycosyltransferase [Ferruginibacter sp.]
AEGNRVTIVTFSLQYPGFLFPGTTQFSSEPKPADLDIQVSINSINPLNWVRIGNQLRKQKPALIVVRYWLPFMGPCLGTILRRIRKNKQTKIVCIADNIIPHESRPGDQAFTRYFVKPVDAFVTMSEKVLQDLSVFDQQKPRQLITHPLYDNFGDILPQAEARKTLQLPETGFVFLFFGFIRPYKGLDWLLEAFRLLLDQTNQPVRLLIAGEFYTDRAPIDALIEQYQLKDHLILRTDFIPDSQVKYYLCAADAVVQPYKNATQSGVTPLAYHFEIPMIVTRVGGLPGMVPDGKVGLIAEPNPADIAAKMKQLMASDLTAFRQQIAIEKRKYGWDKLVHAIRSLAGIS